MANRYTITGAGSVVDERVYKGRGTSALDIVCGQVSNKPARYFLSTRLTHRMLVTNIRPTVTDGERDQTISEFARKPASADPFRELESLPRRPAAHRGRGHGTSGVGTAYRPLNGPISTSSSSPSPTRTKSATSTSSRTTTTTSPP
ncbi:hypothetical protein ACFQ8C_02040 [Streptomyces sp. NPDC056503]|uniref:hypothetical protein n=1 Tax=Streptomyces sp. NPDC056503 TaxID=3345842 RepID=UPI0036B6721B